MKTVLLHGLGQTAQDWKEVVCQLSTSNVECPELFSSTGNEISYFRILADLERQYSNATEPLRICGLSFGALLALDFTIRHGNKVDSLILIGAQYKVLPQATLQIIPGAGHEISKDAPEAIATILNNYTV